MRRCQIDILKLDLPCDHRAPAFIKFVNPRIGDRRKRKVWLCLDHFRWLKENEQAIRDSLDEE